MQTFRCECGARTFFANTRCVTCGRDLGFAPDLGRMVSVGADDPPGAVPFKRCANFRADGGCNWLVTDQEGDLCQSCKLTEIIPDLSREENLARWDRMELAKRHLMYTLNTLRLPVRAKATHPKGLAFRFLSDRPGEKVLTGHAEGVVTLNLREADPVARERTRMAMQERYRTVLGHMRHEIGHYYFYLMLEDSPLLPEYRELFGDEREDYQKALEAHYAREDNDGTWPHQQFISHYAAAHPWEDWAETWAHLMHIVDTLETAQEVNLVRGDLAIVDLLAHDCDKLVEEWTEVSVALNMLNRSMGMPDAYPFAITGPVKEKLRFVARVICSAAGAQTSKVDEAGTGDPAQAAS